MKQRPTGIVRAPLTARQARTLSARIRKAAEAGHKSTRANGRQAAHEQDVAADALNQYASEIERASLKQR